MPDEPPYGIIADAFEKGDVIPFLGAGVNAGTRNPPGAPWHEKAPFLPRGTELSVYLADQCQFPSEHDYERRDLAKVAAYYVDSSDPESLLDDLHSVFDSDYVPCGIHGYLAGLPQLRLIITTNYDDLLEQAFRKAKRSYFLVIHSTNSEIYRASVLCWKYDAEKHDAVYDPEPLHPGDLAGFIDSDTTTIIYKMHGTVDRSQSKRDSYVITEDDYVEFLSRMATKTAVPSLFIQYFQGRRILFLGYGLGDWNLRLVLRDFLKRRSWAIQFNPSPFEKSLWRNRDVKIYDMDIDEFVERLRAHGNRTTNPK
ncbi:MAG TPA: SIR2 family protein [Blastocatellia bacterium]|nr:SIR2 family protein [Blastocatellia bacterium]